ncbi:MAG: resolvase [Desulfuromonas sp.]|nr:MAG: resolvase [Desulfuromonas sp.]
MSQDRFTSYLRVSTDRQGKSGLGLEAQRKQVSDFISASGGVLDAEFIEVESGKNNNREELEKAIRHSQLTGSKLVIAKLDRLSRSLHYITSLAESKIEFVVCDLPGCDQFTINLYGAMAQREVELVSQRTKMALRAAKSKGKTLGNPQNLNASSAAKGRRLGVLARKEKAVSFAKKVTPKINELQSKGLSLNQIARELNESGILTARGKTGSWTPTAVKNVILRQEKEELT